MAWAENLTEGEAQQGDLIALTSLDKLLLILAILVTLFTKQATLMWMRLNI
jgi:hypothetical protein